VLGPTSRLKKTPQKILFVRTPFVIKLLREMDHMEGFGAAGPEKLLPRVINRHRNAQIAIPGCFHSEMLPATSLSVSLEDCGDCILSLVLKAFRKFKVSDHFCMPFLSVSSAQK
jgi:hypothetical protein